MRARQSNGISLTRFGDESAWSVQHSTCRIAFCLAGGTVLDAEIPAMFAGSWNVVGFGYAFHSILRWGTEYVNLSDLTTLTRSHRHCAAQVSALSQILRQLCTDIPPHHRYQNTRWLHGRSTGKSSIEEKMTSVWVDSADENPNHNQNQRDVTTQLVISVALGILAFLGFCVRAFLQRLAKAESYQDIPS